MDLARDMREYPELEKEVSPAVVGAFSASVGDLRVKN